VPRAAMMPDHRPGFAAMRLGEQAKLRVLAGEGGHQVAAGVTGAVVDNQHFADVGGVLGISHHVRETAGAQVRFLVVAGDDDGNARCGRRIHDRNVP